MSVEECGSGGVGLGVSGGVFGEHSSCVVLCNRADQAYYALFNVLLLRLSWRTLRGKK